MTDTQLELPEVPKPDKLESLMALARRMEELHDLMNAKMKELEEISETGKQIEEILIPDLMQELGLDEIKLKSGRKVFIKRDYSTSVTKANWDAAAQWLKDNKMDSIIKGALIIDPKYQDQLKNIPFQLERKIHPSTLKALVREQCELPNSTFPRDLFSVYEMNRAVVKES